MRVALSQMAVAASVARMTDDYTHYYPGGLLEEEILQAVVGESHHHVAASFAGGALDTGGHGDGALVMGTIGDLRSSLWLPHDSVFHRGVSDSLSTAGSPELGDHMELTRGD